MFNSLGRIRGYTVLAVVQLLYFLIRTKLFWRPARLIRFPIQIRNSGEIKGAVNLTTGKYCRIDVFNNGTLTIGNDVQMNDACHIACASTVHISDGTLIASRVFISDHDHSMNNFDELVIKPVHIGRRCWIGENVSILKGVTLGDKCIVGANAVVTRSFPANSILVGCPAKQLLSRNQVEK